MWKPFLKKENDLSNEDVKLSPYRTSPTWAIESFFIDVYFLLAHRIKGLGWTLNDFWACDTWTTSKLYCMELNIIDEEEKSLNENKDEANDSDDVKDLMAEMYGE